MSKRAALHKSHNNTGLARRLVPLDDHSTTGRQIRRQMFQYLSKKPFPTHKCRGSQRRDFEEEWLQRPILVVKSCKGDEKILKRLSVLKRDSMTDKIDKNVH